MIKNDKCPKCGSKEIGQGEQIAGGKMLPMGGLGLSFGSAVISDICTKCGYILEMRVEKPEKFK